jgi:hypothetical protein
VRRARLPLAGCSERAGNLATVYTLYAEHRGRHRPQGDAALGWDSAVDADDITDVDALSLAVPYCDVVVTEKFAHHVLVASGVAKRMSTVVLPSTSQLADHFARVRGAL